MRAAWFLPGDAGRLVDKAVTILIHDLSRRGRNMNLIASSLAGRLRLRAPALRRPSTMRRLAADLAVLPGVLEATCNDRAGSILLNYDATLVSPADFEAAALRAAGEVLGAGMPRPEAAPASAPQAPHRLVPPSLRVRINRQAKRGMLTSLLVSLALAATGAKRAHVVSGGFFLGFLALHLAVHRHHLLR
jgi:hypothetical protein